MHVPAARLVDLRQLRGSDLETVLDAQQGHWREQLAWDSSGAIEAIRRMLDRQILHGWALVVDECLAGYSYFVLKGRKAVIGELFILSDLRSRRLERLLLESTINAASVRGGVVRVEGQLACLPRMPDVCPALRGTLHAYQRVLMIKDGLAGLPGQPLLDPRVCFVPWTEALLHDASELIALTYDGHVDAHINEQYGSVSGARRFLMQATQQDGSGRFFPSAGVVAREAGAAALQGMCLGSLVSDRVGHITQLCVAPSSRRCGLGSELLRRAVGAFAQGGCKSVSLTVTVSNQHAVHLYERAGFRSLASFPAFVWRRA